MKRGTVVAALLALVLGGLAIGSTSGGLNLSDSQRIQLVELAHRVLADGLQARTTSVRAAAAWALGRVSEPAEDISLLLRALREERAWSVKAAAAAALARRGAAEAAYDIAEALRQAPDELTRRAFRDALIALGAPAVPVLEDLLRDPEDGVRRAAALALGRIGSPEALPALLGALDPRYEGASRVRHQAAQALGELGLPEAVPALLETLAADPEGIVRQAAIGALGQIGDPRAAPALRASLEMEKDMLLRAEAALALGRLRGDDMENTNARVEALLQALQREEEPLVRAAIALGLGEARPRGAVPALVALLHGREPESVRRSAAWALARIATPEARSALREALSADPEIRLAAAFALGGAGDPAAVPALRGAALDDPDPEDRARAAQLLGSLSDPTAAEALVQLLRSDRYASVRRAAAEALGALGDADAAAVPLALPALVAALETDRDRSVRAAAAAALGELGDPQAVPALKRALETVGAEAGAGAGEDSAPVLEGTLAGALAEALARLGSASLPALGELLEAEGETARRAAAYGLERLARSAASAERDGDDPDLVAGLSELLPLLHEKLLAERVGLEQINAAGALWAILQL